jgi:hypothetical protein
MGVLEDLAIALFDHHRSTRQRGQLSHHEPHPPADHRRDQVVGCLALDNGNDVASKLNRVVAAGQPFANRGRLLAAESVRILLARVDQDLKHLPMSSRSRDMNAWPSLLCRLGRLPEDHFSTAGAGDHELRAVLASPIEDQIDGGAPARTAAYRDPKDDLSISGPACGPMAVDLRGSRPGVSGLEHDASRTERDSDEVGE